MILVSAWRGIGGDTVETFEIFIQLGAILAVVALFPKRFLSLCSFGKKSAGLAGVRGIAAFMAACAPIFVLGFLFHKKIKAILFGPVSVAFALIVGGILLIVIEGRKKNPQVLSVDGISLKQAALIGIAQCFALWPGMSRSGSTIIGGMLLGIERRVAAEFSFLVAVPVMFAAVGYDLIKSLPALSVADAPIFAFGFVCAFFISLFAVRFFLQLLGKITLSSFGWYRIAVGALVLAFSL